MGIPLTYFLWRHGQVYGPYSGQELNSFLAQGRAQLSDMARTQGMSQWAPLFTIWPGASAPTLGVASAQAPEAAVGAYPAGSNTAALATQQQAIIDVQPSPRSNPVSWPFLEKNWFSSLWMLLLWWFPLPVPVPVGILLGVGWMIDAARRRSTGMGLLPESRDIGRMLLDGFFVALFLVLYILLPLLLINLVTSFGLWTVFYDAVLWLTHYLRNEPNFEFWAKVYGQFLLSVWGPVIQALCVAIVTPLFIAATVRFTSTRKARSFLNVPANLYVLLRNLWGFVKFGLMSAIVVFALMLISGLLLPTGVGDIFIIPVVAAGIWSISYLLGNLVAQVSRSRS